MSDTIRVEGLRELNRAFARADKTLKTEKNKALKEAGEVVRSDAETLATSRITRMTIPWSRMRVGVTTKVVYVAPKQRSRRGGDNRRPRFGTKLLEEAMVPALDRNRQQVINNLEDVLKDMERTWAR